MLFKENMFLGGDGRLWKGFEITIPYEAGAAQGWSSRECYREKQLELKGMLS